MSEKPAFRPLRAYALDPTLSQQLSSADIGEATIQVPWEALKPGPIGEYLEVIDIDHPAGCFYIPVDLDDRDILVQGGLAPAEGTPQFHQQMVYAVASLTIRHFEEALGRRALWAPRPGKMEHEDSTYVQRLRVYPHALVEANAYYSPAKVALLFGYFSATASDLSSHAPGSTVFTCLSHDIVAHETAHALLDGLARRLRRPTNPDSLAFHEAFADLVALFQHFTFPEVVCHYLARTGGSVRSGEGPLAQLAVQFGRATGSGTALRSYIGHFDAQTGTWRRHDPSSTDLHDAVEPHRRGAVLVAAVFDAFQTLYEVKTADLMRIATGGSGILPPGMLPPDLVNRLADTATELARQVLTMCVRAIDYCPPIDLTFGEFLRAMITADLELDPVGERHEYRVAMAEAFRRRGIVPHDVRSMSIDNLRWRAIDVDAYYPSPRLEAIFQKMRNDALEQLYARSRHECFDRERQFRLELHDELKPIIQTGESSGDHRDAEGDCALLGVEKGRPFEVHAARAAFHRDSRGNPRPSLLVQITQTAAVGTPEEFRGGTSLVIDLLRPQIRYSIRKSFSSDTRRRRQRAFHESDAITGLWDTYYADWREEPVGAEPFALLHRRGH